MSRVIVLDEFDIFRFYRWVLSVLIILQIDTVAKYPLHNLTTPFFTCLTGFISGGDLWRYYPWPEPEAQGCKSNFTLLFFYSILSSPLFLRRRAENWTCGKKNWLSVLHKMSEIKRIPCVWWSVLINIWCSEIYCSHIGLLCKAQSDVYGCAQSEWDILISTWLVVNHLIKTCSKVCWSSLSASRVFTWWDR